MRARIAAKMTHIFDRPEIPVAPGSRSMFDGSPTYCKDINHAVVVGLGDPVPTGDGVDLLIDTVRQHAGEAVIVAIGPWTNIAQAFDRAPDLAAAVPRMVLMGGQVDPPGPESNIRCDPSAAAYVLDLPVDKLLVPLEVTRRQRYRVKDHGRLLRAGTRRANLVADLMRSWQLGRRGGDPSAEPVLHDPLALALAFDPSLATAAEPMRIQVQMTAAGEAVTTPQAGDRPNVEVVRAVDEERFAHLFAQRIVAPEDTDE
jgi:purine nucleosidase